MRVGYSFLCAFPYNHHTFYFYIEKTVFVEHTVRTLYRIVDHYWLDLAALQLSPALRKTFYDSTVLEYSAALPPSADVRFDVHQEYPQTFLELANAFKGFEDTVSL